MEIDSSTAKKRIVILGGGFAGVEAARYLDHTAAKRQDIEVTLVSRENFTVFTPMLHEVAAGDLEPNHICNPLVWSFSTATSNLSISLKGALPSLTPPV